MPIIGYLKDEEYRAMPGISQSELGLMAVSPRHYAKRFDVEREQSEAMRMGSFLHLALLEPALFKARYVVEPMFVEFDNATEPLNRRKPAHRAWIKAWRDARPESIVVTEDEMTRLTGMLSEIAQHEELKVLFNLPCQNEVVATWDWEGLACKAKADKFIPNHPQFGRTIVDVKKTQDASAAGFSRSIFNYRYDLQAGFYMAGFEADTYIWVAVEDRGVHGIGIYRADQTIVDRGQIQAIRLLKLLKQCEDSGTWPSYTKAVDNILLPTWVAALDQEAR